MAYPVDHGALRNSFLSQLLIDPEPPGSD